MISKLKFYLKKSTTKREKGKFFEKIAFFYLLTKGYKPVYCNFYTNFGEIDLICIKNDQIIFFEIKGGKDKYKIFELLNKNKIKKIKKVAKFFISKNIDYQLFNLRIDALIIIAREGNYEFYHYKNI